MCVLSMSYDLSHVGEQLRYAWWSVHACVSFLVGSAGGSRRVDALSVVHSSASRMASAKGCGFANSEHRYVL